MRKIRTVRGLQNYIRRENHQDFQTMENCGYDTTLAKEWFSWASNYAYRTPSGCLVFVEGATELSGCPFLRQIEEVER